VFVLLLLLILYWEWLPVLWPSPVIAVGVPTSASLDEDVPVRVVVSAWHANVRIVRVRFYLDYLDPLGSTASGPRGLFYPMLLYTDRQQSWWPYWSLSRLTWPRRFEVVRAVPLREIGRAGGAGSGVIRGAIDVTVEYPVWEELALWLGGYRSEVETRSVPFEIQVRPLAGS
jgi:hypothetical protein